MTRIDRSLLEGRWLHAHEEDTPGRTVFRPSTYPLPPSRGRRGYVLHADGHLERIGIARDDRGSVLVGSWQLAADGGLTLRLPGRADEVLEVARAGDGGLVLVRAST